MKVKKEKAGRKRRAAGWALLALGLLVAGVWVVSGWVGVSYIRPTWLIDFGSGQVRLLTGPFDKPKIGWGIGSHSPWWDWSVTEGQRQPSSEGFRLLFVKYFTEAPLPLYTTTKVVFWPIPLLLWIPAALLFRSGILARRRALSGKCKSCGYDLAGLGVYANCPECGKAPK